MSKDMVRDREEVMSRSEEKFVIVMGGGGGGGIIGMPRWRVENLGRWPGLRNGAWTAGPRAEKPRWSWSAGLSRLQPPSRSTTAHRYVRRGEGGASSSSARILLSSSSVGSPGDEGPLLVTMTSCDAMDATDARRCAASRSVDVRLVAITGGVGIASFSR